MKLLTAVCFHLIQRFRMYFSSLVSFLLDARLFLSYFTAVCFPKKEFKLQCSEWLMNQAYVTLSPRLFKTTQKRLKLLSFKIKSVIEGNFFCYVLCGKILSLFC